MLSKDDLKVVYKMYSGYLYTPDRELYKYSLLSLFSYLEIIVDKITKGIVIDESINKYQSIFIKEFLELFIKNDLNIEEEIYKNFYDKNDYIYNKFEDYFLKNMLYKVPTTIEDIFNRNEKSDDFEEEEIKMFLSNLRDIYMNFEILQTYIPINKDNKLVFMKYPMIYHKDDVLKKVTVYLSHEPLNLIKDNNNIINYLEQFIKSNIKSGLEIEYIIIDSEIEKPYVDILKSKYSNIEIFEITKEFSEIMRKLSSIDTYTIDTEILYNKLYDVISKQINFNGFGMINKYNVEYVNRINKCGNNIYYSPYLELLIKLIDTAIKTIILDYFDKRILNSIYNKSSILTIRKVDELKVIRDIIEKDKLVYVENKNLIIDINFFKKKPVEIMEHFLYVDYYTDEEMVVNSIKSYKKIFENIDDEKWKSKSGITEILKIMNIVTQIYLTNLRILFDNGTILKK